MKEEHTQQLDQFAQVGPPRNLTIEEIAEGYLIKWEAPAYGIESFRIYKLRWFVEPDYDFVGSIETINQYYILKDLEEDKIYRFQVAAYSFDNHEALSLEVEILIPPVRRMRAVAIGTITGIAFIIIALGIFIYTKRKWFLKLTEAQTNVKS